MDTSERDLDTSIPEQAQPPTFTMNRKERRKAARMMRRKTPDGKLSGKQCDLLHLRLKFERRERRRQAMKEDFGEA